MSRSNHVRVPSLLLSFAVRRHIAIQATGLPHGQSVDQENYPMDFSVCMDFWLYVLTRSVSRMAKVQSSGGLSPGVRKHVDTTPEQRCTRKVDNSISRCAEFGASNLELSKSR